ncbi:MAG: hypothetical protein AAF824_05775 [Bacteroidota bacterium]
MRKNALCLLVVGLLLASAFPLLAQESGPAFLHNNHKHKLKKKLPKKLLKEKSPFSYRPPASDKRARLVTSKRHKIELFPVLTISDDVPAHMYPIRPKQRPARKYLRKKRKRNYPHTTAYR